MTVTTLREWIDQQRCDHPDSATAGDLVEIRAESIYRLIWLLESNKREHRAQVTESLRSWVGVL